MATRAIKTPANADQGNGASASPSGSRPSDQAPSGLAASRFDPSRIASLIGYRYSPNLAKWLRYATRRHGRFWGMPAVFRDRDDLRWIGWIDDECWFVGCRLMRCLTVGSKAEIGCWTFPVTNLSEEGDFWARYEAIGRCAIDEAHSIWFIGDETRWATDGDTRSCLWCGNHTQQLRRWTEAVERERWEAAMKESA